MQELARACRFRKILGDCEYISRINNPENTRKFYKVYQHIFYAVTQSLDGSLGNLTLNLKKDKPQCITKLLP